MAIVGIVARRRVADLEDAIEFYEQLCDQPAQRFQFGGARLASVGPFLLFCADGDLGDRLARVSATVSVDDVSVQIEELRRLGAEIVAEPTSTPNGQRFVARHPDGGVFEYVGP